MADGAWRTILFRSAFVRVHRKRYSLSWHAWRCVSSRTSLLWDKMRHSGGSAVWLLRDWPLCSRLCMGKIAASIFLYMDSILGYMLGHSKSNQILGCGNHCVG